MFYGRIHDTGKMMMLTQKWEHKKDSGNIMTKNYDPLSAEKGQMDFFLEKLEQDRENSKYTAIYNKIMNGEELTAAEEEALRVKNPQAYSEYKADQAERKAYEEKLRNCKSKEEVDQVHSNKIMSNFSRMQAIMSDANIGKAAKLAQAQQILGDTLATAKITAKFKQTAEYEQLPTEEEVKEAQKAECEEQQIDIEADSEVMTEESAETKNADSAEKADDAGKPEADKAAGTEKPETARDIEITQKAERANSPKRKSPAISDVDMKVILQIQTMVKSEIGAEIGGKLDIRI